MQKHKEPFNGVAALGAFVLAGVLAALSPSAQAENVTLPVVREMTCDVLVVGGGTSGFSAAVCAARHGAKTILAERNGYLGGMATSGLVGPFMTATTPDGKVQLIRGFFDEFVRAMAARGGAIHPSKAKVGSFSSYRSGGHRGMTTFQPETFKIVAEEICASAGVRLLYHLLFVKASTSSDGRITAAYFATKSGMWKVTAKVYVDATGDGDVAFSAGAPMVYGDGKGGAQSSSLFFRIGNVDKAAMDAHDRACAKRGDIPGRYYQEEIKAARAAGEFPSARTRTEVYEQLDGTWIVNMGQVDDVDGTDPAQVSAAEIEGRAQAEAIVKFLRKNVKGCENCELAVSAEQLGVRETRRIVGEYVVTSEDASVSLRYPDSVFCCANHLDLHQKRGVKYVVRKTEDPFYIPYRALLPKKVGNLLVAGRCASTDRLVMGAIRVMPPCFAMGQAAGTAAALAVETGRAPRDVDAKELVRRLVADGVYLPEAPSS